MRLASILSLLALLAACAKQEAPETEADVVIHVAAGGIVHWNGERVRLADVSARFHTLEGGATFVVDGASDADWAHVQWVVAVVRARHRIPPVTVTCESRDPVQILPDEFIRSLGDIPYLRMELRRTEHGATKFVLGQRVTTRADEACRWIGDGGSFVDSYGVFLIEAAGDVPFGDVHAALRSASELDQVNMDVGVERPELGVMLQDPLPVTRWVLGQRRQYYWSLSQRDLAPLTLPLATAAQQDKDDDPDDRFILNVDSEGAVLYKGESISLERFAQALQDAGRTYDRIKRLKDPNNPHAGYEKLKDGRLLSKLYLLLRADHDLPWSRVLPVLETLDTSGFYKLQFATVRYGTLPHSPEDAARVGVERVEIAPSYVDELDYKLPCWLAVEPRPDSAKYIEIEITADERFRIDGIEVLEVASLADEIKNRRRVFDQDENVYLVGRVRALPDTRFQLVVSAVDAFARAGMEKVDLR